MVCVRLAAFVIGLLLATAGWFVDKAEDFAIVRRVVAPDAFVARDAFERISEGGAGDVTELSEPGVRELLARWPMPDGVRVRVVGIQRSASALELPTVENGRGEGRASPSACFQWWTRSTG